MAKEDHIFTRPFGVFIQDGLERKVLISDPSTSQKKLNSHVKRIQNKIKREGSYTSPTGKVYIDTPNRVGIDPIKEGETKGSVRKFNVKVPSDEPPTRRASSSRRASSARGGGGGGGVPFGLHYLEGNLPGRRKMNKGGLVSATKYFKHKVNKDN